MIVAETSVQVPELSRSAQDYLKQLYVLGEREERVNTQALADAMKVTPASATGMIRKLAELGLVQHTAYQGAVLTLKGEQLALEMVRHHRLIEAYLHQALNYPLDELHDEAERLEHVISERLEARMAAFLGHPSHDPHGDPIPTLEGVLPLREDRPLTALKVGALALVVRVPDGDPAQLRALMTAGLTPGASIRVSRIEPAFGTLTLMVGDTERTLALTVAAHVFVGINAEPVT
ncbi:metal-dependent transcriptional regulator [Deinococcus detaillensis]|uniref:Manganese transport regulator n=1 Tax=Deinococcus detaillensis TaxID=2592048 RepID=A0A553USM6_9DEIO|nr:metal-dependent transcriptional regulator [Deinococcus detaillensis]TSA83175.1 metal-dependent transcriptional regulator [Deinococcus detaillensis]